MRRELLIVSLIIALSVPLAAQLTLSVPVTTAQVAGVRHAVVISDPDDDNVTEGDVTNAEAQAYAIARCTAIVDNYVALRSAAREQRENIRTQYLSLSDANKAAVEAYITQCVNTGTCP